MPGPTQPHTRQLRLKVDPRFDLRLVLFSHGWIDLQPHSWDQAAQAWETALLLRNKPVDLRLRQGRAGLSVRLQGASKISDVMAAEARTILARMLRLDCDLWPFWDRCRQHPELAWVSRRQAGRIFRSSTCFEDMMKLLFTTNCNWAATRKMTERLVSELGRPAPSGRRAFPTAEACAAKSERFYRESIRTGYRAAACVLLAKGFACGTLGEESLSPPGSDIGLVRKRLLSLHGFGPYAAGQAMRLLGRYDDLALDSWCRSKLARMAGRKKPPSDQTVERRYARFGPFKGLALWMDLTADWHGEREPDSQDQVLGAV